jgi:hypothetical protein
MAFSVKAIAAIVVLGLLLVAPRPTLLLCASLAAVAMILKEWSRPAPVREKVATPSCTDRFHEDKARRTCGLIVMHFLLL